MHYVIYGRNSIEKTIKMKLTSEYKEQEIITVLDSDNLDSLFSTVKFRPFFRKDWLLLIDLDKFSNEDFLKLVPYFRSDKVTLFLQVDRNVELYTTIYRSKVLSKLDNLTIINAKFPNEEFFKKTLISKVKKLFTNDVINYVTKELRFKIEELDMVVDKMNEYEGDVITLKEMKRLLPPSKTKDIRSMIYSILLFNREDLTKDWKNREMSIIISNANKKVKPFNILNNLEMKPSIALNIILQTFKNMIFIKQLFLKGHIGQTSIFKEKESLEKIYPTLKNISIPTCVDYMKVTKEVTFNRINYCYNLFLNLSAKEPDDLSMEDLYLVVYKILNSINNMVEVKK